MWNFKDYLKNAWSNLVYVFHLCVGQLRALLPDSEVIEAPHDPGSDPLYILDGIGIVRAQQLEDLGISTMTDLAYLGDEWEEEHGGDEKGKDKLYASRSQLVFWRQQAREYIAENSK